jgi:hypothetical protein
VEGQAHSLRAKTKAERKNKLKPSKTISEYEILIQTFLKYV